MINVVIYCIISYFVIKNYVLFRQKGGLHGKAKDMSEKLLESKVGQALAKKVEEGANKVGLTDKTNKV